MPLNGLRKFEMSFVTRMSLSLVLVAIALGVWYLRDVLLIAFGGFIFAAVLSALAEGIHRLVKLPHRWAVVLTILILLLLLGTLIWLAGGALADQFGQLQQQIPRAFEALRGWLQESTFGQRVLDMWQTSSGGEISGSKVAGAAGTTLGAIATSLLILLLGVFMALEPKLYTQGLLRLVPPRHRELASSTMSDAGKALRGWLKGQGVAMVFVGVATGVGLTLLGIPLALVLGVIAGLLAFVPYFGPIASGVLAILVAFVEGPRAMMYVAALVIVIQQVEGNLLEPLIQRWAVQLPPVLGLISVVIFSSLFGVAGVLFATPLMVVLIVLIRRLYVEQIESKQSVVAST